MSETGDKLFRYAYHLLGDRQEAEDVLQEVLIKLWKMKPKVDVERNLEALVFRMIKNKCLDRLRALSRNPLQSDHEMPELVTHQNPLSELETKESFEQLTGIIQSLPDLQRDILIFRNMENYSIAKIAELMDLKINTVEVYLSRARRKVHETYLTQNCH